MLRIQKIDHLASRLGTSCSHLKEVSASVEEHCQEFLQFDPSKPNKNRAVLAVQGPLRKLQDRLLRQVLLKALKPSPYSYGGVKGRSIKQNVLKHTGSTFVYTADISNFYPSISNNRVYRLFCDRFGCSPDVARICTRLCTYNRHLALGLVTSPLLADQLMHSIDHRIAGACDACGLTYTRFVDDISVSGGFSLDQSGFPQMLTQILADHGLRLNPNKHLFGRLDEGVPITKLRLRHGKLDVQRAYVEELERQLDDAAALANGSPSGRAYFTRAQIRGRIEFVCWINPGRRGRLMSKFRAIPWAKVELHATQLGLIAQKKQLKPIADKAKAPV